MTLLYINNVYQGWGNVNVQRKYDQRHTSLTPQHDNACMRMQDDGLTYVDMRVHHKKYWKFDGNSIIVAYCPDMQKTCMLVKKYEYMSKIEEIVGINT